MADSPNHPTTADATEINPPDELTIEENDSRSIVENADIQRLRTTQHHQSWSQHPSSFGLPPDPLLPQGNAQLTNEVATSLPRANRTEEEPWDERQWIRAPPQESERGIMNAWLRRTQPGSRHHAPSTVRNRRLPRAEVDATPVTDTSPPRDGPARRQEWIENLLILYQIQADQNIPLTDRTFIVYDPVEGTPDDDPFLTRIAVEDPEEECGICGQVFGEVEVVVRLPCRHCFHRECIFTWFVRYRRDTCPFCRRSFEIQRMPWQFVASVLEL